MKNGKRQKNFLDKESISLASPAKVNLFFRVLNRRGDGCHEIVSLCQVVSLFDFIALTLSERDHLECTSSEVPVDFHNLAFRALIKFREKTGWDRRVHIKLHKQIPIQAGLGGGSGNAATVLWGLNKLSSLDKPEKELAHWAAELGSDCPFFFSHGTALCRGKGEIVQEIGQLPPRNFWLVKPKEGLSTPLVYQRCIPSMVEDKKVAQYLDEFSLGGLPLCNDLESSAFSLLPELFELKKQLESLQFHPVSMTGSGTALLCFAENFSSEAESFFKEHPSLSLYPVEFVNRKEGCWYNRFLA